MTKRIEKEKPMKFTRLDAKEIQRVKALVKEAKTHDKHTCNCEGCKLWWTIVVRMHQSGMLYEIFPLSERKHTPLSYHHEQLIILNVVDTKGMPPLHSVWFARNQIISRIA